MGDLDLILDQLGRVVRSGRRLAILFDYDGTLAPVRPTPTEAIIPTATRRALVRLSKNPGTAIGIVSGRALADLRYMVGLDGLYFAGTSGLEVDLLGRKLSPPGLEKARAVLDQFADDLERLAARYHGAWLEKKRFGLTLHYRGVSPDLAEPLRRDATAVLAPWMGFVRVEDVILGLEVIPEVGWDKGSAVREILADLGGEHFPVYVGDAANDAPALVAVDVAGGLSIGVGPGAPPAATRVAGSDEVGALVIMLSLRLQETGGDIFNPSHPTGRFGRTTGPGNGSSPHPPVVGVRSPQT